MLVGGGANQEVVETDNENTIESNTGADRRGDKNANGLVPVASDDEKQLQAKKTH